MAEHHHHAEHHEKTITVRVLRQDSPHDASHWETFNVPYEEGMNVTTVLLRIAAHPETADHHATTPVAYDVNCLEEVCGSCTMIINGRVRQGCSALVDTLLKDASELELRPMTKYPVVRDLVVNRSRMFDRLKQIKGWIPVDGYHDLGPGPRVHPRVQEQAYPISRCMTCGCCTEACPQFNEKSDFIGPMAVAQAILFNMHPTGEALADDRLAVLSGPGGITDCGNSQNCVKVCPKEVPLTEAIARAGRDTTTYKFRKWFGR